MKNDPLTQINTMKIGEHKDIIFTNGILRTTKTLIRNSQYEWEINRFTNGWDTATLTLTQAVKYCKGELKDNNLNWY